MLPLIEIYGFKLENWTLGGFVMVIGEELNWENEDVEWLRWTANGSSVKASWSIDRLRSSSSRDVVPRVSRNEYCRLSSLDRSNRRTTGTFLDDEEEGVRERVPTAADWVLR